MTICIGSLCEGGKTIVFAADRMVTAGYISLEFEHQEKKVDTIKDFCAVMSSGDALVAFELVERLKKESTTLKTVAEIADKLYRFLIDHPSSAPNKNIFSHADLTGSPVEKERKK